jgi:hypothetical protein
MFIEWSGKYMAKKVLDEMPKEEAEKALEAVEKEEKEAKACKKCSAKKFIIPCIAVVVAAVIGCACFLGYRMIFGDNPVKITTKAIRGLKDSIKDVKKDSNGMTDILEGEDPYEISTKVTLSLPEGLGKYNLNALIQADSKNEAAKVDVKAKQNGKDILSFNALLNESKLYFKLADTMKNYYYLDIADMMKEFTDGASKTQSSIDPELVKLVSNYDFSKVIDYAADAIESVFDKDDFKKSKETITINDKDVKATKYTAKLTQEKAIKVAKAFAKKAKNDKDLIKIIALASGEKEATIKKYLDELIDTEAENLSDDYILYSVYVSSLGKTLGCGFELEGLGSIVIANKGDVTTVSVKAGEYVGTLNIEEKSDDHVVITANFMGMITAELDIKSDLDTVKKNKEYKETVDVKLNISALGQSMKASLNAVTTVKKISKIDTVDVKNAINLETMSYAQEYQFEKEVEKSSLYKLIEGLMPKTTATNYNVAY